MIEHRGIANLLGIHVGVFKIVPDDHIIQFANFSFDAVGVGDIYGIVERSRTYLLNRETIDNYELFTGICRNMI